ncbi:MAG: cysteine dioxygenase [Crocinitomicaceae bacterium]|nr:cysteine dioxygenase [Crocinitomicaceae bacterium]|tara:strand:- start:5550 stop:6179 length:630 start_codon:yes stop_codon:yes gene_type:complete
MILKAIQKIRKPHNSKINAYFRNQHTTKQRFTETMDEITSIEQLLKLLPDCSEKEFVSLARRLTIPVEAYSPYMHFKPEHYTRNCISRSKDYELLLLCWEEGQETALHGHEGEECWVKVLDGKIKEELVVADPDTGALKTERIIELESGDISYMTDEIGFHSLHNIGENRSMSLHLYVDPIEQCKVYNDDREAFVNKKLSYHSYEGKVL